ncbi:hypothetical protein OROGR_008693 [Orobanche gracilis]
MNKSPASVVRVPRSYAPKSQNHSFLTSQVANKKKTVAEENRKNDRPASAPRPRAVLSSPGDGPMDQHLSDRPMDQDLYFKPPYLSTFFKHLTRVCLFRVYFPCELRLSGGFKD